MTPFKISLEMEDKEKNTRSIKLLKNLKYFLTKFKTIEIIIIVLVKIKIYVDNRKQVFY